MSNNSSLSPAASPEVGFAPLIERLRNQCALTVLPYVQTPDLLLGTVTGELFGQVKAQFKANRKICTFLLLVAEVRDFEIPQASKFFLQLLELNFKHPLGRISIAQIPGVSVNREEPFLKFVVCETMFFWIEAVKNQEWFKEKALDRLAALASLHSDATGATHAYRAEKTA